jgi:hypothetical protein
LLRERRRHQRRGLDTGGERDATGGKSKGEFQKVAAFHHISSSVCYVRERGVSSCRDERALNRAFSFLVGGLDAKSFGRRAISPE